MSLTEQKYTVTKTTQVIHCDECGVIVGRYDEGEAIREPSWPESTRVVVKSIKDFAALLRRDYCVNCLPKVVKKLEKILPKHQGEPDE